MEYQPGTILHNKYRIEANVGQGAFGDVYRVTHLRLNMLRAIKVLRRDTLGVGSQRFQEARERFDFEARLGARLEHPNVIKVYDFEGAESELLLVMEYASGGSLAELLESGQTLDVDQAIRLGMDICAGLSAIHEKLGAVHRDLKPSNILFGEDGNAKICDLGLAQVPDDHSRRSLLGSEAKAQPGTPAYMSPEQESSKGFLLPSSDIFSLGCVLFEVLTGKPYKAVYGRRLRELRPEVPAWLDEIICRALAETPGRVPADDPDPSKRYRTIGQMRRELLRGWQEELARRAKEISCLEAQAQICP